MNKDQIHNLMIKATTNGQLACVINTLTSVYMGLEDHPELASAVYDLSLRTKTIYDRLTKDIGAIVEKEVGPRDN